MKTIKRAVAVAGLMGLAGCMGNTSQTSANIMGLQSMTGVQRAAQTQPSEQDLAMSCGEAQTELGTLYARSDAINQAERKQERKASLTGGLIEAGLSVIGAGAIADAGSAQAISNVGMATVVAGTAASGVRGSGGPDAQTYNEALAIAERSALLERVKLANDC
ncbi:MULTISPECIES: hypothetical protein [Leisingera]|uniref:hypothetical protein n=2 Tax=Roseobacteraceae TaxID=2854170 RepID=UPI0004074745|nr:MULTISPECIES: hypothetical protein [Leisingera]